MRKNLVVIPVASILVLIGSVVGAQAGCASYPYTLTNGTTADATQVMADFNCAALTGSPTFGSNVGIGINATLSNFQVLSDMAVTNGSGIGGEFTVIATPTGAYSIMRDAAGTGTIIFDGRGTNSSYVNNGGSFGVGTSSPGAKIDVGGSLRVGAANGSGGTAVSTNAASVVLGGRGDTESLVSFVELGDNAHAGSRNFALSNGFGGSAGLLSIYGSTTNGGDPFSGTQALYLDASGNLGVAGSASKPGGGSWSTPSDRRLKKQVAPLDGASALQKIERLKPVTFEWKNTMQHAQDVKPGGFIAQEVREVFPEFVATKACDGADCQLVGGKSASEYYLHLPVKFDAYLVASIQELSKEVTADHATIGKMESQAKKIAALESQLSSSVRQVTAMKNARENDAEKISFLEDRLSSLERKINVRTAQR